MRTKFSTSVICIMICMLFCVKFSFSQDEFATIRKNVNVLAKTLKHDLNASKDTLILEGKEPIRRLYTIGENAGVVDDYIYNRFYKLPLHQLKNGRYLFVAFESRKRIVFEINVLGSSAKSNTTAVTTATILDANPINSPIETSRAIAYKEHSDLLEAVNKKELRPYNITDKDRTGMQTREEVKRLKAEARSKRRLRLKEPAQTN